MLKFSKFSIAPSRRRVVLPELLRRQARDIRIAWAATLWRALGWREMAGRYYDHVATVGPFEEPN